MSRTTLAVLRGDYVEPVADTEIAWAAGIFEGEGCLSFRNIYSKPRKDGSVGVYPICTMVLVMSDEDVVDRWADITSRIAGVERGTGRTLDKKKANRLQMYRVQLTGWVVIERLYSAFKPYLGERRTAKFEDAFATRPMEA